MNLFAGPIRGIDLELKGIFAPLIMVQIIIVVREYEKRRAR